MGKHAGEHEQDFDPDRLWGVGGWVTHEGCPEALIAGQTAATHSKAFHRRGPLPGVLHAAEVGSSKAPSDG